MHAKREISPAFAALLAAAIAVCALAGCSPAQTADGVYEAEVETDSSMVHVVYATVEVSDGEMEATMALHGEGFSRLYLGSSEEAETASDADIYEYYLDDDGWYTFTFPLEAVDEEVDVALFGHRRDRWYDHTLVFTLGEETEDAGAGSEGEGSEGAGDASFEENSLDASDLEDGSYTVEVELDGGTGRAGVGSPMELSVEDGDVVGTIIWSSSNYDLMTVEGEDYEPVTTEGGSTFEIPVESLEEDLEFSAETTAMSEPHTIDYTLSFDLSTLRAA